MKRVKMIFEIAKAELRGIFCSPIAWVLLIAFLVQASGLFVELLGRPVTGAELGDRLYNLTEQVYSERGLFGGMLSHIYFYIPLLTMGLISQEFSSGSIKLLYSSPISNAQIVLGKYMSMVSFALIMTAILVPFTLYGFVAIENFDFSMTLPGLLGIFLITCTYASVGLFMSSVTTYQFVAAISTFSILGLLSLVKYMWMGVPFVRDITYWLGISGRAEYLIRGMFCSEDIIYFFIVSALFVTLTILRLNSVRQKLSFKTSWSRYIIAISAACLLGYISSRPMLMGYYDATRNKKNSLCIEGQEVLAQMKGGLTITTYVNYFDRNRHLAMPNHQLQDKNLRFRKYWRFKPETKFKYVYFYDEIEPKSEVVDEVALREKMIKQADIEEQDTSLFMTPSQIRKIIDLSGEGNRLVRVVERESGEKTFLRLFDDSHSIPTEPEILSAFKRTITKSPRLAYLTSNGTRDALNQGERGYGRHVYDKKSRYSMINNGYDIFDVNLEQKLADDTNVLFIADVRESLSEVAMANLKEFIERGGNVIITTDVKHQDAANSILQMIGVKAMSGQLACMWDNFDYDLISGKMTPASTKIDKRFSLMRDYNSIVSFPGAVSLEYVADKGFDVIPLVVTPDKNSWNELTTTNFNDEKATISSDGTEIEQSNPVVIALTRNVGGKMQKIVVSGDSDFMSNGEFERYRKGFNARNKSFLFGLLSWLSDGECYIHIENVPSIDNKILVNLKDLEYLKWICLRIAPAILIFISLFIWIRRRSR